MLQQLRGNPGIITVLVATPQPTPGEFLVFELINISGPLPITVLAPGSVAGISGKNDNLLFLPPNPAYFSLGGLAIGAPANYADLACNGSNSGCVFLYPDGMTKPITNLSIEQFSVPGPTIGAGLPGLIFASGGLLAWWRRKRCAQAAA
jgi:hypothetical protein